MPGLSLSGGGAGSGGAAARAGPAPGLGWSGKLPSRGDFVGGGGASGTLAAWRDWCRPGLAAVARAGGAAEDTFLTAPFWRIAAAAGVLGPRGFLGVACPGADRAGRLFPILVAAERPDLDAAAPAALEAALAAAGPWAEAVESALLAALDPAASPEGLTAALPPPPAAGPAPPPDPAAAPATPGGLPDRLAAPRPLGAAPPARLGAAPAPAEDARPAALFRAARPAPRRILHRGPADPALFAVLFGPPPYAAPSDSARGDDRGDAPSDAP